MISAATRLALSSGCLVALATASSAWSQTADVTNLTEPRAYTGIQAGVSWSDNLGRATDNIKSSAFGLLGLDFGYDRDSPRLRSHLDVNTVYQSYTNKAFNDGFVGEIFGSGALKLIGDKLEWTAQDNFSQARVDPFVPVGPSNQQNINLFSTGPDLALSIGAQTVLRVSGRYALATYEATDFDNERTGGTVALVRRTGPSSSISINGSVDQTTFKEGSYSGYETRSGYFSYRLAGRRTGGFADLGYLEVTGVGTNLGGPVANLGVTHKVSAISSLTVSVSTRYGDAGQILRARQEQDGAGTGQSTFVSAADPVQDRVASIRWNAVGVRTRLTVNVERSKTSYSQSTFLDRDQWRYSAVIHRRLTQRLDIDAELRAATEDFANVNASNKDLQASLSLGARVGQQTVLRLRYDRFSRSSGEIGGGFSENRIGLVAQFAPSLLQAR